MLFQVVYRDIRYTLVTVIMGATVVMEATVTTIATIAIAIIAIIVATVVPVAIAATVAIIVLVVVVTVQQYTAHQTTIIKFLETICLDGVI